MCAIYSSCLIYVYDCMYVKSDESNVIDNMSVTKEIQDSIVLIELLYLLLFYNYAHNLYFALNHYIVVIRF